MSRKQGIVLIGMPSCGKSTVGVLLAKAAGLRFIDTDLLIQEDQGMLLQQIIDEKGNAAFLEIEARVLCSLETVPAVIATGGSCVYSERAMQHLRRLGTVVYLSLPLATIESRLRNIRTRGVAMEPGESIAGLYEKRVPLYERWADIVLPTDGLGLEEEVAAILRHATPLPRRDGDADSVR